MKGVAHRRLALAVLVVILAGGADGGRAEPEEGGGQAAGAEDGLWEGMTEPNADYDWLRPPDGVFRQALEQMIEGQVPGVPLYTYQCGEMLGCRRTLRFGKKRSLARLNFATPVRLLVEDIVRHQSRHAAITGPEDWTTQRGVFRVSLLIQAKKRKDKPGIALQAGEEVLLSAGLTATDRRMENCWLGGGEKCWRSLLMATFEVAGDTRLRGRGLIRIEWAKEKTEVPINFDYLW